MATKHSPDPADAPATTDPPAADIPRRTTSVYMPVALLDELDEVAESMERSRTWIMEKAVREWLERRKRGRV